MSVQGGTTPREIQMHTVIYKGMSTEVSEFVKISGDKIYINARYKGKQRDLFLQDLEPSTKFSQEIFEIQMLRANIIAAKLRIMELRGTLTDDFLERTLPFVIKGQ
jgi:hypothetical protein